MRLERRHQPLLSLGHFLLRMGRYLAFSGTLIGVSLIVGVAGYHWIVGLGWLDSLLNASFILTGMGPVDPMRTPEAKIYASAYSLFSGVVFFSAVGVLLTPLFHRVLHHFHMDLEDAGGHRRTER